ncbi:uncharacterized protein BN591_01989 [Catenibacterium sp. CAG:290]|uniref:hypothetical protein n=1 Tax=Catenibacterium sp. CAG:290 TaxID=1262767 RepID=UPI000340FF39|nr:hypothetical protein [Catenibacterium sp. CAG:290]CDE27834.1 uncharacterized protein BN591_01989 [Catenibacterium sp. CAG:290]
MKQFFYLFKSKKKLLLFSIYFIVVIVGIFISYKGAFSSIPEKEMILMKSKDPEMGLDFFYYLQDSGLTLILYVLTTLILPSIISADFLLYEHNKFNHFLITRMSSSLYHKKERQFNFLATFILIFMTHLLTILIIHLFFFKISFSINPIYMNATRQTNLLSSSLLLNLIIYMILSSIGYALFSDFLFSLQYFIKNVYLYRTLGLLVSLILYIGASVLSHTFYNTSGSLTATLAYFLNIINILTPSIIKSPVLNNNPHLFYIGTALLYYLLSSILFGMRDYHDSTT